jgi:hypothetical protein
MVLCLVGISQNKQINKIDPIAKGRIILKINPKYKSSCKLNEINIAKYNELISSYGCKVKKSFPNISSPITEKDKNGNILVDLTSVYELTFDSSISVSELVNSFGSLAETEYCQPVYLPQVFATINDPGSNAQYALTNIKAYQAWDLCKGDSNIIIGITDTGIENAHEDLIDNIFYNYDDPINGQDDDFDGYVDNFRGWDIGNNDNSPEWDENGTGFNPHGVYVSGFAAARTNNAIGIAAAGYFTKFLPVKISDSTGALIRAYEGIVYAADHNCAVINCSWGGQTPHPYGQDIINYATFNRNALVVAAAGNNGHTTNDVLYPASYDNVLCVGASNNTDLKWNHSCYGTQVDLLAPGENVYTTNYDNGYVYGWGTSFASPIAASCAALVKKWYGNSINATQLGEILRMTCDNIDTVPGNIPFAGLMGRGRINLYRALTDSLPPSVKFINFNLISNSGNFIKPGDTVQLKGDFINYLSTTKNLKVKISSNSNNVHFVNDSNVIGVINKMQTISNNSLPFVFYIDQNSGYDEEVTFTLQFLDSLYSDKQLFKAVINQSYADIDTNNITLTLTSNGKLGYNNYYPVQGSGVRFNNGETQLFEGGLTIAQNSSKMLKCFRSADNFSINKGLQPVSPIANAAEQWSSVFSDNMAGSAKLGLNIKMDAMEWNSAERLDFVFLNYTIYNKNNYNLDSLFAGIFCDWDIVNPVRNKSLFNQSLRMSYSWYTGLTNLYTGLKLLSNQNGFSYAFDNTSTGSGGINISDGLSNSELFQALRTNRDAAGVSANGNDVANLVSFGPFNIAANDSITLSFALMVSNSLYNIEQTAANAQILYDSLYRNIDENKIEAEYLKVFPNPSNGHLNVSFYSNSKFVTTLRIFDIQGKEVYALNELKINEGENIFSINSKLPKGVYLLKLNSLNEIYSKLIVVKL